MCKEKEKTKEKEQKESISVLEYLIKKGINVHEEIKL